MSADSQPPPTISVKEAAAPPSSSALPAAAAGGAAAAANERTKSGHGSSVASTANQILFKNELYTSMKQKTMDHELMARLNREAQEDESKRFEEAKAKVARLENKRKILVGVGDMVGPPGCDPNPFSSASIAVELSPNDTVWDVKKKLIVAVPWKDEAPDDFGLFDDFSEEPLKDALAIESALAASKPASAGRAGGKRGAGLGRSPAPIRLPPPYVGVVWAARLN